MQKQLENLYFSDCTAPFQVSIVTDALTDAATPDATTANLQQSRGNFRQKSSLFCIPKINYTTEIMLSKPRFTFQL